VLLLVYACHACQAPANVHVPCARSQALVCLPGAEHAGLSHASWVGLSSCMHGWAQPSKTRSVSHHAPRAAIGVTCCGSGQQLLVNGRGCHAQYRMMMLAIGPFMA